MTRLFIRPRIDSPARALPLSHPIEIDVKPISKKQLLLLLHIKVTECHGTGHRARYSAENGRYSFDGNESLITNTSCVMQNKMFADCYLLLFPFECFRHFVWNGVSTAKVTESHTWIGWRLQYAIALKSVFPFVRSLVRSPNRLLNFVRRFGRYTCDIRTHS